MSATAATIQVVEYSMDELRSIIERSRDGLSQSEQEKLWSVIESYAHLLEELGDKKASIARLRQMIFGQKSESKADLKKRTGKSGNGGKDQPKKKKKKKRKGHGCY